MINLQAIGHLGRDAQVNDVNGKKVINFSIAHTEKYKDKNGNPLSRTLWVECSYWTDRTTIGQYLKQGTQVHVSGTPSLDTYKNRDNITMATLRLRVQDVQLLGGKKADGEPAPVAGDVPKPIPQEAVDDLPF